MLSMLKYFGVQIPKVNGQAIDLNEIKKQEFQNQANKMVLKKLYKILNIENQNQQPEVNSSFFRFFVGMGNNHWSVRQIIKRRSWWHKCRSDFFMNSNEENSEDSHGVHFIWTQWKQPELIQQLNTAKGSGVRLVYNRLEDNFHLANKKALFMNMCSFYRRQGLDPFEVAIPLTFHIKSQSDPEYANFIMMFNQLETDEECRNIWIVKPGENSNRGCGIEVADTLPEIKSLINANARSNGN